MRTEISPVETWLISLTLFTANKRLSKKLVLLRPFAASKYEIHKSLIVAFMKKEPSDQNSISVSDVGTPKEVASELVTAVVRFASNTELLIRFL